MPLFELCLYYYTVLREEEIIRWDENIAIRQDPETAVLDRQYLVDADGPFLVLQFTLFFVLC